MDPLQNPGLQNAKLNSLLSNLQRQSINSASDMPPPPAYHMVVNPNVPASNMHDPYGLEEDEKEDGDIPEINVNAMTQIRGHGNIISITQMDSVRIANLIAALLQGGVPMMTPPPPPPPSSPPSSQQQQQQQQPQPQQQPQQESAQSHPPAPAHAIHAAHAAHAAQAQPRKPERREIRPFPKVNINVNCGATVIGDRNIVGPGLGDIARHMQMAQRNQAAQQQNQMNANRTAAAQSPGLGFPMCGPAPMATPPMSRSSSFGSEGPASLKRKAEGGAEESSAKRAC